MRKRIVICADGTWNRPEENLNEDIPSNVLRLARSIRPIADDGLPQQVFYDWGIGSYHDQVSAGITGKGLHKNIMDDYRYVVQNYKPDDELFFFGFSRGAYTIRSLCGLMNNVGIVKREDANLIQAAFDHYKKPGPLHAPHGEASIAFRAAHSHPAMKIRFVGVWDTVGAMGIPFSFLGLFRDKDEFYDTKIGPNIVCARHAMAIDEQRSDFVPTVWDPREELDIRQVWFAGAHSDLGGGYKRDRDGGLLSDNALNWMKREAEAAGLTFEPHLERSIQPSPMAEIHKSRRSFYRVKRPFLRDMNHGKGDVLFHQTVKDRWDADERYRPKQLVEYLKATRTWGPLQ